MPGLFKQGDNLVHDFVDALGVQALLKASPSPWGPLPDVPNAAHVTRATGVVVIAEESPGKYRCQTPFGVTMLIDEKRLNHLRNTNGSTAADIAAIVTST